MNPHPDNDSLDWADTFDDMDGEDWQEHFSLFEPDDDRREREEERALLKAEQVEFSMDYDEEDWRQDYARKLDVIPRTATLGMLAKGCGSETDHYQ